MIDVQQITKRYGQHTAIDRVTFSVAKGEVLAFLGPNGAGKTTTMSGEIDRVRLTYPTTEIVLYRVSDKPKPKWKIRYPVEAEADLNEVRMLLFRLEDLKAVGIIDPGPGRDALAKTLKHVKVKITLHARSPFQFPLHVRQASRPSRRSSWGFLLNDRIVSPIRSNVACYLFIASLPRTTSPMKFSSFPICRSAANCRLNSSDGNWVARRSA